MPRFERLPTERRDALLAIAAREFAKKGFDAASLNEILAAAGLGKSSYYYYFADKEDLFATVAEQLWSEFAEAEPRPDLRKLTARQFWPTVEAWAERSVKMMAERPELIALGREIQAKWSSPHPRFRELVARTHAETRAVLRLGQKLGCVRTDLDLDWLVAITRAADQAVDERLLQRRGKVQQKELERHVRIALDTFRRLVEAR